MVLLITLIPLGSFSFSLLEVGIPRIFPCAIRPMSEGAGMGILLISEYVTYIYIQEVE